MLKTKTFSEQNAFAQKAANAVWNKALVAGSRSVKDANLRKAVYANVFKRYNENKIAMKRFSGVADLPLLSNQYFNATMVSYVRSFAGYLSIERDMAQPTALLWYCDLMDLNGGTVLSNIGKENIANLGNVKKFTGASALTNFQASTIDCIPGSIRVKYHNTTSNASFVAVDAAGWIMGAPGAFTQTSAFTYTGSTPLAGGLAVTTDWAIDSIEYAQDSSEDALGTDVKTFKLQQYSVEAVSHPDMLVAQSNIQAIAAMQQAIGADPLEIASAKITELYIKLVNAKLVGCLKDGWSQHNGTAVAYNPSTKVGNTVEFDMATVQTSGSYHTFDSILDYFASKFIDLDTLLAVQSTKGVKATAIVAGESMCNWLRKCAQTGVFVDEAESSYINDLLGTFKGIPVLRHEDLADDECYCIHKTVDGQMAPVIRGIFLPLTATPSVGNYNNVSQFAEGVYYQEAYECVFPQLIARGVLNQI